MDDKKREINEIFYAFAQVDFDKVEELIAKTTIHPNEIVYQGGWLPSSPNCVQPGMTIFSSIINNIKHTYQKTPCTPHDQKKRQAQMMRILTMLKEKGYDLEMPRQRGPHHGGGGELYTIALAACMRQDSIWRYIFVKHLLELGCRIDTYPHSDHILYYTFVWNSDNGYVALELLLLLIKYGLDVHLKDDWKRKPIDVFRNLFKNYLHPLADRWYDARKLDRIRKFEQLLLQGKPYAEQLQKEMDEETRREEEKKRQEEEKKRQEAERKRQEVIQRKKVAEEERKRQEELQKQRQAEEAKRQRLAAIQREKEAEEERKRQEVLRKQKEAEEAKQRQEAERRRQEEEKQRQLMIQREKEAKRQKQLKNNSIFLKVATTNYKKTMEYIQFLPVDHIDSIVSFLKQIQVEMKPSDSVDEESPPEYEASQLDSYIIELETKKDTNKKVVWNKQQLDKMASAYFLIALHNIQMLSETNDIPFLEQYLKHYVSVLLLKANQSFLPATKVKFRKELPIDLAKYID